MTGSEQHFDRRPDSYEAWFQTPIGRLILREETALIRELAKPHPADRVLDAGCGTGLFTRLFTETGAWVTGLDISVPMLARARQHFPQAVMPPVAGSLTALPFTDGIFDKTISITTIEFIGDGHQAVAEMFRVTRPGGLVVVATLNRLSPWADRRTRDARSDPDSIFRHAIFRTPDELAALSLVDGRMMTAIHFDKTDDPNQAIEIEKQGRQTGSMTGAFLAAVWQRPHSAQTSQSGTD